MTDSPDAPDRALAVSTRIERFVAGMMKHVDAVQVLATWTEGGETLTAEFGEGNAHARVNMAREFAAQPAVEVVGDDDD